MLPAFLINYVTGRRQITKVRVDKWLSFISFRNELHDYYKIVNETHSLLEILTYVAYSRKHFIPRDICFYRNIIFLSGSQKQILQVGIELRTFSYFMIFFYL